MKTAINVCLAVVLLAGVGVAQSPDETVERILQDENYQRALAYIENDHNRFVKELIELTEIPAPPFKEEVRAQAFMEMLRRHGLTDIQIDQEGNVMGIRKGSGGPLLAVAAHLDTVFPEGTDVTVKREGTKLSAPGIGDDTAGLATLLSVIRAMDDAELQTTSDILFIGDVGEEGPGDLRGMKYLFREGDYKDLIRMFVSVEGGRHTSITNGALGSKRYRVTFKGPGGHSYGAFGIVSPAFAMGNAMRKFSLLEVSEDPKTTFNVGVIGGGTSVNSIPFESWMEVDMRSEVRADLDALAETFIGLMHEAVDEENAARSTAQGEIELEMTMIGDRPSGQTAEDSPIAHMTSSAFRAFGIEPTYRISSTDSNIPISMGIPAITIGRGGMGGRSHSLDEWVDVEEEITIQGIQVTLTTILALAGLAQ
jgi:di/tripeptidase